MLKDMRAWIHLVHGDCHAFMYYLCGERRSKEKAEEHYITYKELKKRA